MRACVARARDAVGLLRPCRLHLGELGLLIPPAEVDLLVEVGRLEDGPRVGLLLVKLLVGWPPAWVIRARGTCWRGGDARARGLVGLLQGLVRVALHRT